MNPNTIRPWPQLTNAQEAATLLAAKVEGQGATALQNTLGCTAGVSVGSLGFDNRGNCFYGVERNVVFSANYRF